MNEFEIIQENTTYLLNEWSIIPVMLIIFTILSIIFFIINWIKGNHDTAGALFIIIGVSITFVFYSIVTNSITDYTIKVTNGQSTELLESQYDILQIINNGTFERIFIVRKKPLNQEKNYLPINNMGE